MNLGNAVWIEDPGFLGARIAFGATGARLIPAPIDEEGVNVGAVSKRRANPRLIYVTPSHLYLPGALSFQVGESV
jgi:GntR family transcriptional regulator / MocR family aminotransferase